MKQLTQVLDCYGKAAESYADAFVYEFCYKPLDRLLLTRFADENRQRGTVIDLGCGPGQTTAFLHGAGLTDVIGTDVSPAMVAVARQRNEADLCFDVADMLHLPYGDQAFGGAIAFYSIVHLTMYELALAFEEMYRVLRPAGQLLLAFHTWQPEDGPREHEQTEFMGHPVAVTFYVFDPDDVLGLAREAGFICQDAIIRYPYAEEYPTKRAYMLLSKS